MSLIFKYKKPDRCCEQQKIISSPFPLTEKKNRLEKKRKLKNLKIINGVYFTQMRLILLFSRDQILRQTREERAFL